MLLFGGVPAARLETIRREGLPGEVCLWATLEAALQSGAEAVLVVDAGRLPAPPVAAGEGRWCAPGVPPGALANADPYIPPVPVTAAGGYVIRPGAREPEVLLIFRRGVWDLPKGKCDPGETVPDCAVREVCEEVGAKAVRLVAPVGTTLHGYPRRGRYEVKTTHWYLMTTDSTHFTPQAEEDIEAVAWVPWSEARLRVGYATLRRHMDTVAPHLENVFGSIEGRKEP